MIKLPHAKNFLLTWYPQIGWFEYKVSNVLRKQVLQGRWDNMCANDSPFSACLTPWRGERDADAPRPFQPPSLHPCGTSTPDPGAGESTFLFFLGPMAASAVRLASRCLICASSCCCIFVLKRKQGLSFHALFLLLQNIDTKGFSKLS